ncbi:MAG: chorismate mutase [Alphaproteobacteria bacterium]|nr:MAG: chorismate mutase [Alphaproteobacteria bacterium]
MVNIQIGDGMKKMTDETTSEELLKKEAGGLAALRQEIDAIDDQIHDLLMRRTEVVHGVARVKNAARQVGEEEHLVPSLAMRPEREADILRRLKGRHKGELPFHVIAQLWRELINAKTRLQGPMSVALYIPGDDSRPFGMRDLARAYYGAATTLNIRVTAFAALAEVVQVPGVIGVVPMPVPGEDDPWWPHLLAFDGLNELGGPRVVMRLPFLVEDPEAPNYPEAMTIACMDQVESGDDRSLFIAICRWNAEDFEVVGQCAELGLTVKVIDAHGGGVPHTRRLFLLESDAFVSPSDQRLEALKSTQGPVSELRSVGGYAAPIVGRK